jgi:hypothetical protein
LEPLSITEKIVIDDKAVGSRRTRSAGMVLITTMLILVILFMLATMLTVTTLTSSGSSFFDHEKEVALQIAQSGLDYAVWRIEHEPWWEGSLLTHTVPVDTRDLKVREDEGIVAGTVYDRSGNVLGEFRIVFKAETSSPPMTSISYNNIIGFNPRTTPAGRVVSPGMVYLAVEGRTLAGDGRVVRVRRTVEATYINNNGSQSADGVAYAGTDMSVNLLTGSGKWLVDTDDDSFVPSVRSNGNIVASNNNADSIDFFHNKGKVFVGSEGTFTLRYGGKSASGPADQMQTAEFPRLEWEFVRSKYRNLIQKKTDRIEAPAGTYVWTRDESGRYNLNYYAGDYNESDNFSRLTPGANVFASQSVSRDLPQLVINRPLTVVSDPTGNVGCFKIIGKDLPQRPAVYLVSPADAEPEDVPVLYNGDLTGGGDKTIYIGGELSGTGAVVSQGNIRFGGRSILASTSDTMGLLFYSKGDVAIDPISTR